MGIKSFCRDMKHLFLTRLGIVLAVSSLWASLAASAFAHPASGIVVNTNGEVFFVYTGKGACKIEAQGGLTYIHRDTRWALAGSRHGGEIRFRRQ